MEVEGQITIDEWMQWKEDIRRKLKETAGNFVYIGCRLRQIRDSGMLEGAADIFEFAAREFGLSKSTTSRFIAVNERFADPYNPLLIREEFENIGSSKLSEMLTLPDAECALITEKTTVKEIRDLKAFTKEAEKLETETESAVEPVATSQQNTENEPNYSALQKCIIKFFEDKKVTVEEALALIAEEKINEAYKIINPGEYATCKAGICFLFMYDFNRGVTYKLMVPSTTETISWTEFLHMISEIYSERPWEEIYKKEESAEAKIPDLPKPQDVPKTEENEPVRQETSNEPEIKETQNVPESDEQQSVVQRTLHEEEPSIPKPDPVQEPEIEEQEKEDGEEAQIPGQDTVENHKEWMPDESISGQQSTVHQIKLKRQYFKDVADGKKTFELRKNDRGYRVGDVLDMREIKDGEETGQHIRAEITYMLENYEGIEEGYCILAIRLKHDEE